MDDEMSHSEQKPSVRQSYEAFQKLWSLQQGALFLKTANSSLEWKKSIADFFFLSGRQYELERSRKLVESLLRVRDDICCARQTAFENVFREILYTATEKLDKAFAEYEAGNE